MKNNIVHARILIGLSLLCIAAPISAQDVPVLADPISNELSKAKEAYQAAVESARQRLLAAFDEQRERAESNTRLKVDRRIQLAEQLAAEKKAFEQDELELPQSIEMKAATSNYRAAVATAKLKCASAFEVAATAYGRKSDLAAAKAVLAEKDEFFARTLPDSSSFKLLFDGKTLNGWTQRGGLAKFTVQNGEIVGQTVPHAQNSYLCTEREYGDFILELEFNVDAGLNSGIQIRSQVFAAPSKVLVDGASIAIPPNVVHGYQVEIDPDPNTGPLRTGGIYDEGRRKRFLADLASNERGRKAFKQGWNKLRIECKGPSIRTWLNGVPAATLNDNATAKGLIGLQVHGVGARTSPLFVRWRNIRIAELR